MQRTFSDVACTVCGCVCDDLQVSVSEGRVSQVRGACGLAEPWFGALAKPSERSATQINGQAASLENAINRAAEILRNSRKPLIYGLARSSTAGQRAANALAEQLGATIDTPTSCHPGATLALQSVGQSTCSLGEVRNRADLVIFWGTNPVVTHPRHLERYSVDPEGMFVPIGRGDRNVVVVDSAATETSTRADTFLQIAPGSDLEVIKLLRHLISESGDASPPDTDVGAISTQLWRELAERMKSCRYGALFFGPGSQDNEHARAAVEALLQLTTELNKFTRFTAHYIPTSGGMTGAENVLCWQTGFPFAVNFARGYPRYSPAEFSAGGLLERGEVDACVIVGSESVHKLSSDAREQLKQLPTIALDYPNVEPALVATVQFTTAVYGIHAAGTAYRMDGITIPLRQLIPAIYPTDEEVLTKIAEARQ